MLSLRINSFYFKYIFGWLFMQWYFFFTQISASAFYTPICCAAHKPYKWSVSVCVISTISTLTDALHLKSENHPTKNQRWWKPSVLHSWQNDGLEGLEGRACCCLPLLLLFSLWGLRWVSRLRLFLLSSCLKFCLSYSLSCFSLSQPFSLSLSPTPYLVLSLSQGLNLWLWSYRNIGMTTHALFCFVS